ncbi:MAG: undecaprenyl-diphosphatase UppP [Armatimonas sp.]
MHLLQAIVLGIVQGITEFLPISSTAHLEIIPALLGWKDPGAAFTAVIQLGTVVAVLLYFRKDIFDTLKAMLSKEGDPAQKRLGMAVLLGTIPIAVLGLLLKKHIEGSLRSLYVIAITQIVMAIVLWAADKFTKNDRPLNTVTIKDGLVVGAAQCMALVPGASRSGSTLIGAYLTGLAPDAAVRFSFLLSLPAITLAGLLELKDFIKPDLSHEAKPNAMVWSKTDIAISTVVAGIVGYACINWLLRYLAKNSPLVFVIYRIVLGALLLGLLLSGRLAAYPS